MSNSFRLFSHTWVAILLMACGFLVWADVLRIQRVEYLSGLAEPSAAEAPAPGSAAAGNPVWRPNLIVPGHDNTSFEWLDQTQQMFALGQWRVRHVDYENAPFGHRVDSPSPYRWWLGALAWVDHSVSGKPIAPSVEQAALFADPLLHLIFLVGVTLFVAWQFGAFPAALIAVGIATVFPFAAGFIPGAPNDHGMALICLFWSVLLLFPGIVAVYSGRPARRWFFLAGVAGGLGLWIGLAIQVPVLVGIALGGLMAAWVARSAAPQVADSAAKILPWSWWALGGGIASFAAYLIEYYPDHLGSWDLKTIHPLFGLAWLGGGALLAQITEWIQGAGRSRARIGTISRGALYAAAFAALPVVMWRTHNLAFLDTNLRSFQLTMLSGGISADNLWHWLLHEQNTLSLWATILPVLLLAPAGWLIFRSRTQTAVRVSLAVAVVPLLVAAGFACEQLNWWNPVDTLLLVLLVTITTAFVGPNSRRFSRWVWSGLLGVVFVLGALQISPPVHGETTNALDETEIWGLVERDLARWLAMHVPDANTVVLAPNNQTISLYYYGGLRGLATLSKENMDGLGVAVRILSASTPEEAKELVNERGITEIVIPSWDSYLAIYTRMGMGMINGTFYDQLINWQLPPWLKPMPYQFPTISGLEKQSVTILQVVDDQDDATAFSRLGEYFLETGQMNQAARYGLLLRRFPADLGALTVRAEIESAGGNKKEYDRIFESMLRRLAGKADRALPWDRRVSLAVVLAMHQRPDLARIQTRRCIAEATDARLRSLSATSLYRLQVLGKAYGMPISDPHLRQLALDLLPSDFRNHL